MAPNFLFKHDSEESTKCTYRPVGATRALAPTPMADRAPSHIMSRACEENGSNPKLGPLTLLSRFDAEHASRQPDWGDKDVGGIG